MCTHMPLIVTKSPMQCYKMNELEKKRAYEEREREVEHGSFAHEHYTTYITHLSILVLGGWVTLVQLPCCVW